MPALFMPSNRLTSNDRLVLDTNVISEPKRPTPDPQVRAWFEAQDWERLYLTATVVDELAVGIECLPKGRRRADFERWLEALITEDFVGRILAFDADAAVLYGLMSGYNLPSGVGAPSGRPWHRPRRRRTHRRKAREPRRALGCRRTPSPYTVCTKRSRSSIRQTTTRAPASGGGSPSPPS
jgi:hypothetical protein